MMLRAIVKPYHGGGKNGPTKKIEIRKNQTKKKRMKYTHIFSLSDEKLDGVLLKVCWKEYKNWTGRVLKTIPWSKKRMKLLILERKKAFRFFFVQSKRIWRSTSGRQVCLDILGSRASVKTTWSTNYLLQLFEKLKIKFTKIHLLACDSCISVHTHNMTKHQKCINNRFYLDSPKNSWKWRWSIAETSGRDHTF